MIRFFKEKGSRGNSKSNPYPEIPVLELDNAEAGRKGFMPNKKAVSLLGLQCNRTESLVFAQDDQRIFVTVASNDDLKGVKAISAVVGKTGKANNKKAWELVTGTPFANAGEFVKVVEVSEESDADKVFELVSLIEDDNDTSEEADASDVADSQIEEAETAAQDFGF